MFRELEAKKRQRRGSCPATLPGQIVRLSETELERRHNVRVEFLGEGLRAGE